MNLEVEGTPGVPPPWQTIWRVEGAHVRELERERMNFESVELTQLPVSRCSGPELARRASRAIFINFSSAKNATGNACSLFFILINLFHHL